MSSRKYLLLIYMIFAIFYVKIQAQENEGEVSEEEESISSSNSIEEEHNARVGESRLAAQLFAVLDHYKQEDPVGFPGAPIPDPMDVPDMKKNLGMATLNMMQVKAYGLSKFRILSLNVDLKAMQVDAAIELDEMVVNGSYTLSSFFSKANGPFTVVMKKFLVKAIAKLEVERSGRLATEQIKMDITFGEMAMDFQNLGFLGTVFQGIINSAPNLVFDVMKPFMLQESDKKLREEIDKNIKKMMGDRLLPNSITPLDMAIAEGRKKVRAMGYDPYMIPDYNHTVGIFSVQLSGTWITGVSSFYRFGDMIVSMQNNTLGLSFQLGTQEIAGAGQWEVGFGLMSRIGHVEFTIQHIRCTVGVSQSLDTRKRPQITDLQIDLGNIQVRCDGAGTMDYAIEFVVNVLPNLIRYQVMDALENPIKMRIQEKFNQIDVEKAIKNNLDKFETMGTDFAFDFKM